MKDRRNFMKALVAGAAVAGLPPVAEVKVLQVTEQDAVVLKYPGYLRMHNIAALKAEWAKEFPNVRCLVLTEGMDIEVLKGAK